MVFIPSKWEFANVHTDQLATVCSCVSQYFLLEGVGIQVDQCSIFCRNVQHCSLDGFLLMNEISIGRFVLQYQCVGALCARKAAEAYKLQHASCSAIKRFFVY